MEMGKTPAFGSPLPIHGDEKGDAGENTPGEGKGDAGALGEGKGLKSEYS
jgi:hypothetical protein